MRIMMAFDSLEEAPEGEREWRRERETEKEEWEYERHMVYGRREQHVAKRNKVKV